MVKKVLLCASLVGLLWACGSDAQVEMPEVGERLRVVRPGVLCCIDHGVYNAPKPTCQTELYDALQEAKKYVPTEKFTASVVFNGDNLITLTGEYTCDTKECDAKREMRRAEETLDLARAKYEKIAGEAKLRETIGRLMRDCR